MTAEPLRDVTDTFPAACICVVSVPCYCVEGTFTDYTPLLAFLCCSCLLRLSRHTCTCLCAHTAVSWCNNSLFPELVTGIRTCSHRHVCIFLPEFILSLIPLFDCDSGIMGFMHDQMSLSSIKHLDCLTLWSHWCQTAKLVLYLCACFSRYADMCVRLYIPSCVYVCLIEGLVDFSHAANECEFGIKC